MLALCVVPGHPDGAALRDVAKSAPDEAGSVVVRTLEIGICGTDREILTGRTMSVDVGTLNRELVLEHGVVFGTVNASLRHYRAAADALAHAEVPCLQRLISRRVPLSLWRNAFARQDDDLKVVLDSDNHAD